MLGLEQAEESDSLAKALDVKIVLNRGNPSDDLFTSPSQEKLDSRMLMKRVSLGIDQLVNVTTQRRNPVRILTIKPVWKLDEFAPIALRPNRLDANAGAGCRQIRSISRPTRSKASRTKSS